jgi:hypothetical protein
MMQLGLTDYHTDGLFYQMKTTLNIDDQLMAKVKQAAARQGRTMSEFIESALRVALHTNRKQSKRTPLPTFRGGPFRVNVADNDALQDFLEER